MQDTEHLLQGKAFAAKYKPKRLASTKSSFVFAVQNCFVFDFSTYGKEEQFYNRKTSLSIQSLAGVS